MEKSLTYSPTYSLTYLLTRLATRPPLQLETLHLQPFLSLPQNFVLAHARALAEEGGASLPGGPIPITSIVRSTTAYFDKSSRSTFCVSVARFSRLNLRFNRVANTYLLTYSTTVVCLVRLDIGKNDERFLSFKLRIKSSDLNNVDSTNQNCRHLE